MSEGKGILERKEMTWGFEQQASREAQWGGPGVARVSKLLVSSGEGSCCWKHDASAATAAQRSYCRASPISSESLGGFVGTQISWPHSQSF